MNGSIVAIDVLYIAFLRFGQMVELIFMKTMLTFGRTYAAEVRSCYYAYVVLVA